MFSISSLITPNQFEAELLADTKITDLASAVSAMDTLHDMGASSIVITSTESKDDPDSLNLYASQGVRESREKFSIVFPKIHGRQFTGTGDLFASLILARWDGCTRESLARACEKGLATMNSGNLKFQLNSTNF